MRSAGLDLSPNEKVRPPSGRSPGRTFHPLLSHSEKPTSFLAYERPLDPEYYLLLIHSTYSPTILIVYSIHPFPIITAPLELAWLKSSFLSKTNSSSSLFPFQRPDEQHTLSSTSLPQQLSHLSLSQSFPSLHWQSLLSSHLLFHFHFHLLPVPMISSYFPKKKKVHDQGLRYPY